MLAQSRDEGHRRGKPGAPERATGVDPWPNTRRIGVGEDVKVTTFLQVWIRHEITCGMDSAGRYPVALQQVHHRLGLMRHGPLFEVHIEVPPVRPAAQYRIETRVRGPCRFA